MPVNILDELVAAALEHEFFPENAVFTKRYFQGAHGKSGTHDVLVELSDGNTYRIYAELQPKNGEVRSR